MSYKAAISAWADANRNNPEEEYRVHSFDINGHFDWDKAYPEFFLCPLCGHPQGWDMHKKRTHCNTCEFWMEKNFEDKNVVIADQTMYSDGGRKWSEKSQYLGFSGRHFYIEKFDGYLVHTNNLWYAGKIPARFYKGDNAKFIDSRTSKEDLMFLKTVYDLDEEWRSHIGTLEKPKEIRDDDCPF